MSFRLSVGCVTANRVADKVRTLAAVRPALVRLLEWELDRELERAEERSDALCRSRLRFVENDHFAAMPAIEIHGVRGA